MVPASLNATEEAKQAKQPETMANPKQQIIDRIQYLLISSVERLKIELNTEKNKRKEADIIQGKQSLNSAAPVKDANFESAINMTEIPKTIAA